MNVQKIGMAGFGASRPQNIEKTAPSVNEFKSLDEKKIFNYLNFTSLGFKNVPQVLHYYTIPDDEFEKEAKYHAVGYELGVNTPRIDEEKGYYIAGSTADYQTNPIKKEHIRSVFDNVLLMDVGGLIHGDIEYAHVFYRQDCPDVEIDCFRNGYLFEERPHDLKRTFPHHIYPSNIYQFENNSLGHYLEGVEEDERKAFLKDYLVLSSEFHRVRANYIIDSLKGTREQSDYEKLLADLYSDPNDDIIDLFDKRITLEYNQRKYFTEWDNGSGNAKGSTPDEKRAINGVKLHFDSIEAGYQHLDEIDEVLAKYPQDSKMAQYLNYEKKNTEKFIENRCEEASGMACWTINPDNENNKTHRNVPENQREELETLKKTIKKAKIEEQLELSKEIRALYEVLLDY